MGPGSLRMIYDIAVRFSAHTARDDCSWGRTAGNFDITELDKKIGCKETLLLSVVNLFVLSELWINRIYSEDEWDRIAVTVSRWENRPDWGKYLRSYITATK